MLGHMTVVWPNILFLEQVIMTRQRASQAAKVGYFGCFDQGKSHMRFRQEGAAMVDWAGQEKRSHWKAREAREEHHACPTGNRSWRRCSNA
jgi:hypothetical protein